MALPPLIQALANRWGGGGSGGFNYPAPGTPFNGPSRDSAVGSSGFGTPTYVEPPGAFHQAINSLGSAVLGTAARALGSLFGGSSGGVTKSAGGWAIDKDGNLINSGGAPAATTAGGNTTRPGPAPISHTTSIPGYATAFMSETLKRNQI